MATNVMIAGGISKGSAAPYTISPGEFDTLIFDAVTNVSVDLTNTVTSHPIESNTDITDHVYQHNDKFEVTGVVTNTPIQAYTGNIVQYGDGVQRTKIAVDFLRSLKESRNIFTLVTEFEIFDDCIITSLRYNINAQEADQLVFTMGVERVRLVPSQTVTLETEPPVSSTANGSSAQSQKAKEDGTENKSDGSSQKQKHKERTIERTQGTKPQ